MLIHAGTYALYQTPGGGYHLSYRRELSTDDDGRQVPVVNSPDVHCRDLSARAAEIFAQVLDRDQPVPPMIAAFLDGGKLPSIGQIMKQARQFGAALDGQAAAAEDESVLGGPDRWESPMQPVPPEVEAAALASLDGEVSPDGTGPVE